MKKLLDLIHYPYTDDFSTRSKEAIEELFGSPSGRYPDRAKQGISVRAPEIRPSSGVLFNVLLFVSNALVALLAILLVSAGDILRFDLL